MIKVLIADDHGIGRTGLRLLLERADGVKVVGEAADGREFLKVANEVHPDVVIVDIGMPLLNGIEAAAQLARAHPEIGVIVLSMHADESYVTRALTAGARGYV